MDAVMDLVDYAQESLLDLELSHCSMDLNNFNSLARCIKNIGQEDAERHNNGVRRGTFRKLNFSYNPFLKPGQRNKGQNAFNLEQKDENLNEYHGSFFDELGNNDEDGKSHRHDHEEAAEDEDGDSDSEDDQCHDNFTDAFINLIRSQNITKCTHLDLSGILALNQDNVLELMSEVFDYQNCENLLSVHLNDLGMNFNHKVKEEIVDLFRIPTTQEQKLGEGGKGNLYIAFKIFIEKVRGG